MTADLMTKKLLHLSPCPWKAPAQLLHISITSSWLPNVALSSWSFRQAKLSSSFFCSALSNSYCLSDHLMTSTLPKGTESI